MSMSFTILSVFPATIPKYGWKGWLTNTCSLEHTFSLLYPVSPLACLTSISNKSLINLSLIPPLYPLTISNGQDIAGSITSSRLGIFINPRLCNIIMCYKKIREEGRDITHWPGCLVTERYKKTPIPLKSLLTPFISPKKDDPPTISGSFFSNIIANPLDFSSSELMTNSMSISYWFVSSCKSWFSSYEARLRKTAP